jgi:RNA polymerase sigma-70 factor, ECF subfamily
MRTMARGLEVDFPKALAGAKRGDEAAWRDLFEIIAGRVVGFLVVRGVLDPEEVAGEVFADVVRSLKRFKGDRREFVAWTLTIAHRRMVDAIRAAVRRPEDPSPIDQLDRRDPVDVEEVALGLVAADGARRLLSRLTPDQADVLALRIYGELSLPEVARRLHKPLTAVTSLQHRGLETLRRQLEGPAQG